MEATQAKALVRGYFYRNYLPQRLPHARLRGGNYLILLGDKEDELFHLDQLGVPRYRVFSVEREITTSLSQSTRSVFKQLGIALYYGELQDFVRHHLQANQRFLVLNLDVCGSYLTNIDPVMTEILLFARRNPETIVASYTSAGRDRSQLPEGIKSWAICSLLLPELTTEVTTKLYSRYREAGIKEEVSLNMVLRHMFWIRSHWERILMGAAAVNRVESQDAWRYIDELERFWDDANKLLPRPVTLQSLWHAVEQCRREVTPIAGFDLAIEDVEVMTYMGFNHFYQLGWFADYKPISPVTLEEWLRSAMLSLVAHPFICAPQEGATELSLLVENGHRLPEAGVLWKRQKFPKHARRLLIPSSVPFLDSLTPTVDDIREEVAMEESDPTPLTPLKPRPDQVEFIKRMAALGKDTDHISKLLPMVDPKSITAHIAVSRRKKA